MFSIQILEELVSDLLVLFLTGFTRQDNDDHDNKRNDEHPRDASDDSTCRFLGLRKQK